MSTIDDFTGEYCDDKGRWYENYNHYIAVEAYKEELLQADRDLELKDRESMNKEDSFNMVDYANSLLKNFGGKG